MAWTIIIEPLAKAKLGKLDNAVSKRIVNFLHERVATHPDPIKLTEPLKGNLSGYRRFRVGDYRLKADFNKDELTINITRIDHRRDMYVKVKLP
ncbi:MAG: type II toxin-antitoxin system RelE/ParE family toxin [Candidatus Symbiobacter sp.]|nr:type II toxin-antitoxin system RelE/ParE family toxin [Candidatus Symbiobacter sp.]